MPLTYRDPGTSGTQLRYCFWQSRCRQTLESCIERHREAKCLVMLVARNRGKLGRKAEADFTDVSGVCEERREGKLLLWVKSQEKIRIPNARIGLWKHRWCSVARLERFIRPALKGQPNPFDCDAFVRSVVRLWWVDDQSAVRSQTDSSLSASSSGTIPRLSAFC